MSLGLSQLAMLGQLAEISKKLKDQSVAISRGLKSVETEGKVRDEERKKIVIEGVRNALKRLHDKDSDLIKEMKSEVFDKKEDIASVEEEVSRLIKSVKSVKTSSEEEAMTRALDMLTAKVEDLAIEKLSRLIYSMNLYFSYEYNI